MIFLLVNCCQLTLFIYFKIRAIGCDLNGPFTRRTALEFKCCAVCQFKLSVRSQDNINDQLVGCISTKTATGSWP